MTTPTWGLSRTADRGATSAPKSHEARRGAQLATRSVSGFSVLAATGQTGHVDPSVAVKGLLGASEVVDAIEVDRPLGKLASDRQSCGNLTRLPDRCFLVTAEPAASPNRCPGRIDLRHSFLHVVLAHEDKPVAVARTPTLPDAQGFAQL